MTGGRSSIVAVGLVRPGQRRPSIRAAPPSGEPGSRNRISSTSPSPRVATVPEPLDLVGRAADLRGLDQPADEVGLGGRRGRMRYRAGSEIGPPELARPALNSARAWASWAMMRQAIVAHRSTVTHEDDRSHRRHPRVGRRQGSQDAVVPPGPRPRVWWTSPARTSSGTIRARSSRARSLDAGGHHGLGSVHRRDAHGAVARFDELDADDARSWAAGAPTLVESNRPTRHRRFTNTDHPHRPARPHRPRSPATSRDGRHGLLARRDRRTTTLRRSMSNRPSGGFGGRRPTGPSRRAGNASASMAAASPRRARRSSNATTHSYGSEQVGPLALGDRHRPPRRASRSERKLSAGSSQLGWPG